MVRAAEDSRLYTVTLTVCDFSFVPPAVVKAEDMMQDMGPDGMHSDHLSMPKPAPGADDATFSDEEDDVSPGQ